MSDKPATAIWTPDGVVALGEKQPERVELKPGVGEWLRQFADVADALKLGLHCAVCKADVTGKNSDTAKTYAIVCKCREFIWHNRDYVPPGRVN